MSKYSNDSRFWSQKIEFIFVFIFNEATRKSPYKFMNNNFISP